MPTFESAFYATQKPDRANPSRLPAANRISGSIQYAQIEYTLAGTEATNDIINLVILPVGATPLPQLSSISNALAGTGVTAKVGTSGTDTDDDGWYLATAIQAAGTKVCTPTGAALPAFVTPTPLPAGGNTIIVTLTSVNTPTAGVKIWFNLAYKLGR